MNDSPQKTDLALGVDTGGTYTDAALVTWPETEVVTSAKALTTPADLAVGVSGAIHNALADAPDGATRRIGVVGLSTTLATNAIVEGVGNPACLILIGYDIELLRRFDLERHLVTDDVVFITGGHDGAGEETAVLDEEALIAAVARRHGKVDAFAVSGYFSVRNPAHENRARELIRDHGGDLPVTCGGDLTGELDSVRRATTAALNARLIPLLSGLVTTVRSTLDEVGVQAPLMVVKGDGSMVSAEFALERPVETILSGPAASVVGAWHLAGRRDAWVVDVGGTTTDIAVLSDGLPRLDPEGAHVGGWRTMVETLHVHTVGLGGDSHVRVDEHRRISEALQVGPRRVVPLSLLAQEHDGVIAELRRQHGAGAEEYPGEFVLPLAGQDGRTSEQSRRLLQEIGGVPRSLTSMAEASTYGRLALAGLEELERRRLVVRAGFTPTDALHVLGRYHAHDGEAARLGAELLGQLMGLSAEAFCERVVDGVSRRIAVEVAAKALSDEGTEPGWEQDAGAEALIARAFGEHEGSDLSTRFELRRPLVLVGAPVEAYGPGAAERLHTELVVPTHASVANAVGAVAGGVVQHLRVQVRPTERDGIFHVLLPDGIVAVRSLEAGVRIAHERATAYLRDLVHRAGADGVDVGVARNDLTAPIRGESGVALVETELVFTAVGKPLL
ncbi:MAG TPA: hydantoinase/oxoprolinase family protein [Candidatus Latescibacteria bacterium]|jgi:N-methylhydantoinase A/oxoprolinase/acetone carboxylase beta subunit|nr:hydantoinase [Gemmatimonadaceae bacterium]HJP33565.1 hydantoinase/oxoprolinase family protein [Candidatus Latescibacterota bacterium]